MKYFIRNQDLRGAMEVVKIIPNLEVMESLLINTDALRKADGDWVLKDSFRLLESAFVSRESVLGLRDAEFVDEIARTGRNECFVALAATSDDNKYYPLLERCLYDFDNIGRY